jgi:hypothetical protein
LVCSLIVGVVSHSIQVLNKRHEENEAAVSAARSSEQTLTIARNIERLFSVVGVVKLEGSFFISLDDPLLKPYRERIIQRFGNTQNDLDISEAQFISVINEDQWREAADRVRGSGFTVQVYDAKAVIPSCPRDLNRYSKITPRITYGMKPNFGSTVEYPQLAAGFGFPFSTIEPSILIPSREGLSVNDFYGAQS